MNITEIKGGVTAAKGFEAAAAAAAIKYQGRTDMALVYSEKPCHAAGTFTTNIVKAAPVKWDQKIVKESPYAQAVIVNSGIANACTGEEGMGYCKETAEEAAKVLGVPENAVLVASTGVIGMQLPMDRLKKGISLLKEAKGSTPEHGTAASKAIMTTDTVNKEIAVQVELGRKTVTVGGMCKGSGMIMPNMATMIAVITTDAPVEPAALHALLLSTVKQTFNKVTVDSDTSTNDTCIMLASGAAAADAEPIVEGSDAFDELAFAVHEVCESLARNIAADGEGASKLVTVNVTGAANDEEADIAARAVANSPLVKTCIAGHDCNWGRVAMALGKCGVKFNQEDVSIDMMGMPVCRDGLTVPFDEDEALRRFEAPEIVISADLGAGDAATTVWTCDLTHEYISINGDYRS